MNEQRPAIDRYPEDRPRAATIRSRLMLEVASELSGVSGWAPKQVKIGFRSQGDSEWRVAFFGSDAPSAIAEVANGTADIAILNPATAAGPALRGVAPFAAPIPLRGIATVPSYDQFGIAVSPSAGIESFEELATTDRRLRISLRGGRPDHAVHMVLDHLLAAAGTTLDALRSAGHVVGYDDGLPHLPVRSTLMRRGEIDVLIDEGVYNWVEAAQASQWRLLPLSDEILQGLESLGYRRAAIERDRFPSLGEDVATIDFSGWMIYTHLRTPDEIVEPFCDALLRRRDRIPWQGGSSLPIERMVGDTPEAPMPIPLHPAAERFWRDHGLLP